MMLDLIAYAFLFAWAFVLIASAACAWHWRGRWRLAAAIPLLVVILWLLAALLEFPYSHREVFRAELIGLGVAGVLYLAALIAAHRNRRK